jgi:hypothetical protein
MTKKKQAATRSSCEPLVSTPIALAVEISCYRHQAVAPNIHVPSHIFLLNKGPHIDPIGNQRNNLQK